MNAKNLLNKENLNHFEKNKKTQELYEFFLSNYTRHHTCSSFINNDRAIIYFNGNTRVLIEGEKLTLCGFGLRTYKNADLQHVSGCGDEGKIISDNIKEIVNLLATFEEIFPKN